MIQTYDKEQDTGHIHTYNDIVCMSYIQCHTYITMLVNAHRR
eukprot:COSAG01_NODE_45448_length_409_cov_0.996774_1_plen_41_part_01